MTFFILLLTSFILLLTPITNFAHAADGEPIARDKTNSYSTRQAVQTCTADEPSKCMIDTFVVAKDLASDSLLWERRIYFQHYDLAKPLDAQAITVKSINLVGKKLLTAKNSRGDSFELAVDYGHLKKT